jgi:hypothetical protein
VGIEHCAWLVRDLNKIRRTPARAEKEPDKKAIPGLFVFGLYIPFFHACKQFLCEIQAFHLIHLYAQCHMQDLESSGYSMIPS